MEGDIMIYQVIAFTAIAVVCVLFAFILLFFIFFTDSNTFTHQCDLCGQPLPRFHKGYCSEGCKHSDYTPPRQHAPEAVRIYHSLNVFDKPSKPLKIFAIPCQRKAEKTIKFIAAHSAAQAYYRFFYKCPGFTILPAEPETC